MNPMTLVPPDTEGPEWRLWLWLLASANNPVALFLILTIGTIYGTARLMGLLGVRGAAHTRRAITEPNEKRRRSLRAALGILLAAALLCFVLLTQGAVGPALLVASAGFLLWVLLSEFFGSPTPEPVALPANISLADVVSWKRTVDEATPHQTIPHAAPAQGHTNGVEAVTHH
jgi:hypothetical protein